MNEAGRKGTADSAHEAELLAGPLAEALRRGRDRFNTAFFVARQSSPSLDGEAFARHLHLLAPVAEVVARHGAERLDAAVAALYDLSLDLLVRGILDDPARSCLVRRVLSELFPPLHTFLAEDPFEIAGKLINAVLQLDGTPGARPGEWMDLLIRVAPGVSGKSELFDAGRVLAWRCGMAHLRLSALSAAGRLGDRVLFETLGIPQETAGRISAEALLRALADDPWLHPDRAAEKGVGRPRTPRLVAEAGGFCGFGGPFLRPPRACHVDGDLILSDADHAWRMYADVFGVVFVKIFSDIYTAMRFVTAKQELRDDAHGVRVSEDGSIEWSGEEVRCGRVAHPTGVACDGNTAVVTLRHSHRVLLFARTADEPGEGAGAGRAG